MTLSSASHSPDGSAARRPAKTTQRTPATRAPRAAGATAAHPPGRAAAETAHHRNSTHLSLPGVGDVALPSSDQLAFLAGLGVLAAFEIIDWQVAVILGVGHALALDHRHRLLADFGEALEEG